MPGNRLNAGAVGFDFGITTLAIGSTTAKAGTDPAPTSPHTCRMRRNLSKFTGVIYDGSSTLNGSAHLIRTRAGVNQELAAVTSSGSLGLYSISDDSIDYEKIDNSYYSYYVYWNLPVSTPPAGPGDVVGYSMRIEVKFPIYLPLVRR
jgi:hypothetical protein